MDIKLRVTRTRLMLAIAAAALVTAGGAGYAAVTADGGPVINACMLKATGTIRLYDASAPANTLVSKPCSAALETPISWNQHGLNGINGTNGTNGKDGKDGINGTNGTPGSDGAPCLPETNPACIGPQGPPGKDGSPGAKGDPCLPSDPACIGPKGDTGPPGPAGPQGAQGAADLAPVGAFTPTQLVQGAILTCTSTSTNTGAATCTGAKLNGLDVGARAADWNRICLTVTGGGFSDGSGAGLAENPHFAWNGTRWTLISSVVSPTSSLSCSI